MSAGDELPGAPCLVVFCLVESNLPEERSGVYVTVFRASASRPGKGERELERE